MDTDSMYVVTTHLSQFLGSYDEVAYGADPLGDGSNPIIRTKRIPRLRRTAWTSPVTITAVPSEPLYYTMPINIGQYTVLILSHVFGFRSAAIDREDILTLAIWLALHRHVGCTRTRRRQKSFKGWCGRNL